MTRSVKSAERTLALLELFSNSGEPLTVTRVARALAIPQPSASMLLGSLRSLGYLSYDRHRRTYAATLRVALLGRWISAHYDGDTSICARLALLQERVGDSVFLVVEGETHCRYALVLASGDEGSDMAAPGDHAPLTRCAAGHAFLSLRPDRHVLAMLRRCNAEDAGHEPPLSPTPFLRAINHARSEGYAWTPRERAFQHGSIAVLVGVPPGVAPVAIGVGPSRTMTDAERVRIARMLMETASDLVALSRSVPSAASERPLPGLRPMEPHPPSINASSGTGVPVDERRSPSRWPEGA